MDVVDWLLDADPAIRWQAMRDLTEASPAVVTAERARVAHQGLGAQILAVQTMDGTWRRADSPVWSTTLFTLLQLRAAGVNPSDAAVESAITRLRGLRWDDPDGRWDLRCAASGGNPFFDGEVEPCINGGVLALGGYFGHPSVRLAHRLLEEQLEDGGWNCEAPKSTRSSFHTTLCVLEGLLEYERAVGSAPEVAAARRHGEAYLLERSLFRRLSTGVLANAEFLELAFPPRYRYDVLRSLDYFRAANVEPDVRMGDAVQIIKSKQQTDGRWLLDRSYDALPFRFGEAAGEPSLWNTLRALRVLRWYE